MKHRFYSILVRLKEQDVSLSFAASDRGFYSILVRLKASYPNLRGQPGECFYSILVRLKGQHAKVVPRFQSRFLFHIGSIKSFYRHIHFLDDTPFLFHIGSIKSLYLKQPERKIMSFYSILVRLKAIQPGRERAHEMFLFHIGSIKRPTIAPVMKEKITVSIPYWFD